MAWTFRTVPDELLGCAEALVEHYRGLGYTVQIEQKELGYPNTPTFRATRTNTTVVIEVLDRIDDRILDRWAAYGRSCGHDFRVVFGVADVAPITAKAEGRMRELGIGVTQVEKGGVVERIAATDLALNIELPSLGAMPARVRKLLGSAYEKFGRGDWREGFEEACQAFEAEARRYLKRHTRTGRVRVMRKKVPTTLRPREIDSLTMGQLTTVR